MGAGINLFKQLFPEDYYAYQTATLISSKPVSKKIYDSNNQLIAEVALGGDELRGLLKVVDGNLVAVGDVKDSSGNIDVVMLEVTVDGSSDEVWSNQTGLPNLFSYTNLSIKDFATSSALSPLLTDSGLDVQSQNDMVLNSSLEGVGIWSWGNQFVIRK